MLDRARIAHALHVARTKVPGDVWVDVVDGEFVFRRVGADGRSPCPKSRAVRAALGTEGNLEALARLLRRQGAASMKFLGSGFDAATFDLGNGRVLRLWCGEAHPVIPSALWTQPYAQAQLGSVAAEIYPRLATGAVTHADAAKLKRDVLLRHGIEWLDCKAENVGRDRLGRLRIVDVGDEFRRVSKPLARLARQATRR